MLARFKENSKATQRPMGQWVLEHEGVKSWLDKTVPKSSTIKPVLASVVIDHLRQRSTEPFSFFYCKHGDAKKKMLLSFMKAILSQLVAQFNSADREYTEQCVLDKSDDMHPSFCFVGERQLCTKQQASCPPYIDGVTATSIQKHLEDLGSLLAFLRISELEHKAAFRKHIILPFSDDMTAALRRVALLLDSICPQRTQELLYLLQVSEKYYHIELQESERRQDDRLWRTWLALSREKLPCKITDHRDKKVEMEDFLYSLRDNAQITCSLCGISIPAFDLLGSSDSHSHPCGYKLCQECILQNDEAGCVFQDNSFRTRSCPLCKGTIETSHCPGSQSFPGELDDNHFNRQGYSSKMNALIQDLEKGPSGRKASYVYIMEPQWNPSVESQAIGRVARLGQNKEVTVVHYIVRESALPANPKT
ncbi:hypothetical protein BKA60DRAFT_547620 [Fusarium oxysporum]|nr:hypothetical protein BKA60DRAFT_547620 [Fusarium oxysporum]